MNSRLKLITLIFVIVTNCFPIFSKEHLGFECKKMYSSFDDFKTVISDLQLTYKTEEDLFLQIDERVNQIDTNLIVERQHLEFLKLRYYNFVNKGEEALELAEYFIFKENVPFCRHFMHIIDGYFYRLSGQERNDKLIMLINYIENKRQDLPEEYVYKKLGALYFSLKQYQKALDHYLVLVELPGINVRKLAIYHNDIGVYYEELNLKEKAKKHYEKALEYWNKVNHDSEFRRAHAKYFTKIIQNNIYELRLSPEYSDSTMLEYLKEEYALSNINGRNHSGVLALKVADYAFKVKSYKEGIEYTNKITEIVNQGIDLHLEDKIRYNRMLINTYSALGEFDKVIEQSGKLEQSILEKERVFNELNNNIQDLDKDWTTSMLLDRQKALKSEKKIKLLSYLLLSILLVLVIIVYHGYRLQKQSGIIIKTKSKKIESILRTTQMLLKEMHHRVKNNLQLVSSIAYIEYMQNDEKFDFDRFENRIVSLSMIHKLLYTTEYREYIICEEYLGGLVAHLKETSDKPIHITLEIPELKLKSEDMISIGLLVNELITNSVKHCKPLNQDEINIHIQMTKIRLNTVVLIYKDNGGTTNTNQILHQTESLGQDLIDLLIQKLKGRSTLDTVDGYCLKVNIPNLFEN